MHMLRLNSCIYVDFIFVAQGLVAILLVKILFKNHTFPSHVQLSLFVYQGINNNIFEVFFL
jgi:hypothetical protein